MLVVRSFTLAIIFVDRFVTFVNLIFDSIKKNNFLKILNVDFYLHYVMILFKV